MNARKIRENLGRIKPCCKRGEADRALFLFMSALKELGGQTAPLDMRGDFRNGLADVLVLPKIKALAGPSLTYTPGSERELLQHCATVYRAMLDLVDDEEYEVALQRKLNIDRAFKDGKKFLREGKSSEADACFAEAMKYYKDEHAIFGMMARAMLDAGEPVRALGHVRAGLKRRPNDPALQSLLVQCAAMRK